MEEASDSGGGEVVGFGYGGEALDSGSGAVGFGHVLSGWACEAVSSRQRSDRPGRDAGL
jgi:hypothetical protein